MSVKFPSQEWADAMKAKLNSSDSYAEAAKKWEGDISFVIDGTSDIIYMDLWHGECREATYTTDAGDKSPAFKISGKYDSWVKVLKGELDPVQGMMTRQLKLEGNMMKIMQNIKAAQEMVQCATQVDTEF